MKHIKWEGIQALRGFAALAVVILHVTAALKERGLLQGKLLIGEAGVDVFFVISGFVMANSVRGKSGRHAAADFFMKRIRRVLPLYWVFTLLKALVAVIAPFTFSRFVFNGTHLVGSLLFLPFIDATGARLPVLPVGWTLCYEMFFYFIIAAALLFKSPKAVIPVLVLLACVSVFLHGDSFVGYYTSPLLLEFVGGAVIAEMAHRGTSTGKWFGPLILFFSFAVLVSRVFLPVDLEPWGRVLFYGLPALGIVLGVVLAEMCGLWRRHGIMERLGDSSYSLYLVHGFVIPPAVLILNRAGLTQPIWTIPITVVACLAGGWIAFVWIERPLLQLTKTGSRPVVAS